MGVHDAERAGRGSAGPLHGARKPDRPERDDRGPVDRVLRLQAAAGNAAVADAIAQSGPLGRAVVQRIPVPVGFNERIQQDPPPPAAGGTPAASYSVLNAGQSNRFQLTRSGNQLTINVRIKLVSNPNRQPGVKLPVPDADRPAAQTMLAGLTGPWNASNLVMVGRKVLPPGVAGPPEQVRLRTQFVATPVFDVNAAADAFDTEVTFHNRHADPRPQTDAAGNPIIDPATGTQQGGHPIDSGNFYTGTGNPASHYGTTSLDVIYAHEYGHLLGIPDEYSQSNPDMHTVLSTVASQAGQTNHLRRAMDRAGMRHMILQAIRPHVTAQINSISNTVAAAFATRRGQIQKRLADGMRRTWRDRTVVDGLVTLVRDQFAGSPLQRHLRGVMFFEAAQNMSYVTIANAQVGAALDPGAINRLINAAFTQAFNAQVNGGVVNLPYLDETGARQQITMRVDTIGVTEAQLGGAGALQTVAQAAVGTAPAGPTQRGRVPPLGPPGTLLSQLGGLAAEWQARGDLMQAQLDALDARIQANALQSFTAAPLAPLADNTVRGLYRALYARLQTISEQTALAAVTEFIDTDIKAKVRDQVQRLSDSIAGVAETQVTVTPGGGTNLTPPPTPDPAITAAAQAQLELLTKNAQTVQQNAPATGSQVRYTINSMMGNNHAAATMRGDYGRTIAAGVNGDTTGQVKHPDEADFQSQIGSGP
jgi:hypothetical protein